MGIKCSFLHIKNDRNNNKLLNVNNVLCIENNNININGNLNINGKLNLNNIITFDELGNMFFDKFNINEIFKYSVGIGYKFINIQDCINYIEENELNLDSPIFIEIYPNKIYNENIFIKKPNINLIGKYLQVKINGTININYKTSNNNIILKNLLITTKLGYVNDINNIHQIDLKNITFNLKDKSKILISNISYLNIKNSKFDTSEYGEFKLSNIDNTKIYNTNIKLLCNLNSKNLIINESKLKLNYNMNIISDKLIKFRRCDIIIDGLLLKLKNGVLFRNKKCLLNDCIISDNKSEGIIYPTLLLNNNYNV